MDSRLRRYERLSALHTRALALRGHLERTRGYLDPLSLRAYLLTQRLWQRSERAWQDVIYGREVA